MIDLTLLKGEQHIKLDNKLVVAAKRERGSASSKHSVELILYFRNEDGSTTLLRPVDLGLREFQHFWGMHLNGQFVDNRSAGDLIEKASCVKLSKVEDAARRARNAS